MTVPDRFSEPGVRPAVDPELPPSTQRYLLRVLARGDSGRKLAMEYLGPITLVFCVLAALVTGHSGLWLLGAIASLIATFAVRYEVRTAALTRLRRHYVEPGDLDQQSRERLQAAQSAIDVVLSSEVYRTGRLDNAAGPADLRRHEWQIANQLREITGLRAEHTGNVANGVPGPQSRAVLDAHERAIAIADQATGKRVAELQLYVREVQAADAALQDWQTAELLARGNDRYLDLVAHSAADDHAVAELAALTERVRHTRDLFEETMQQVSAAAQVLVFPRAERLQPGAGEETEGVLPDAMSGR
jgi:hypothetical protein